MKTQLHVCEVAYPTLTVLACRVSSM